MKKHIKTNLYAVSDAMAVITLLLLLAFIAKKTNPVYWLTSGFITLLIAACQAVWGKAKIKNECPEIIYTKSEEGCDATELEPGLERYDIDGVKSYGVVYKLSDGVHGVIKKDGTLKVKSITGKFINSVRGGVVPYSPDNCWDALVKAPDTDYLIVK